MFAKLLVYRSNECRFVLEADDGWRNSIVGTPRLDADRDTSAGFAWHSRQSVIVNDLDYERPFRVLALLAEHKIIRCVKKLVGEVGILLTTDADSRVDPNWFGANMAALDAGADAVTGWVELDPLEWGSIPLSLHETDDPQKAQRNTDRKLAGLVLVE